jgi:plastocyanin
MNGLLARCTANDGSRLTRLLLVLCALLPALLLALALGGLASPRHAAAQQLDVRIANFAYAPQTITINVGDALTWTNTDGATHSATADDGLFDTGLLGMGVTSTPITFSMPGTYTYHCRVHGFSMTGTVIVVDPNAPAPSFADVPVGYWAHDQIGTFARRGITTGCDTNLYCPERPVTRAEMAVFLDRTLGFPNPATPASQRFSDVPPAYWAYAFIDQFATLGITTGCGGTEFCPDRGVTRAEMAAFLIRALKQPQSTPDTPTFADVPANHPQFGYVEALVKAGVTTGCGTNDAGQRLYCPDRGVTRAEMAVFIIRAFP